MGLKGYRLWVMGQLDSNVQSPTAVTASNGCPMPVSVRNDQRVGLPLTPGCQLCYMDHTNTRTECHPLVF
jgi:hypothetical protein